MTVLRRVLLTLPLLTLAACFGEMPVEKAVIGTWVQDTPTSMSDAGMESIVSDTVLTLQKDGDASLRRVLTLRAAGLPEEGLALDVDLNGVWALREGKLVQTIEGATVVPRQTGETATVLANELQAEAMRAGESVKTIVTADREQLILQDDRTGATDVYNRK